MVVDILPQVRTFIFLGLLIVSDLILAVSLMIKEPTKTGDLLDLILKKEELVDSVKISSILGCSNHEVVEFRICVRGDDTEVNIV